MMISNVHGKPRIQAMLRCLLSCALLAGVVSAQAEPPHPAGERTVNNRDVADAVAKVKSGKFNSYHVGLIGEARAAEAIPDLEKQFAVVSDPIDKAKIAQVLLALGDKKDAYWNYLAELAKPALDTDAPSPTRYDAQGKSVPDLSPEFVTWVQAHGQSPHEAGENEIYVLPGIVMMVGATEDPRALPLLRRALLSPNYQIEAAAAMGLAEIHDVKSVPLIISRCKQAPAEAATAIAGSLVYFDDPQAQKAVDTYVPNEEAKALREARMMGRGALHR
jgi:HEAT repeat protein